MNSFLVPRLSPLIYHDNREQAITFHRDEEAVLNAARYLDATGKVDYRRVERWFLWSYYLILGQQHPCLSRNSSTDS